MLGIGAAVLGASHVLGIDLDPDALVIAQSNSDAFDALPVRSPTHVHTTYTLKGFVAMAGGLTQSDSTAIHMSARDLEELLEARHIFKYNLS